MRYSHFEKSYFSRTVIQVNTTFVGGTNLHISPNAREINVSYILGLMYGSMISIPSGFIIYVKMLIHRVSPCKQKGGRGYSIVITTMYISLVICDRGIQNGKSSHGDDVKRSKKVTWFRHDANNIYEYSLSWH
jgi:hypothetical protein